MRLGASKPITLKNKILGGDKPLICVPLVSVDEVSLIHEIDKVISLAPDVIEWRIDYFEHFTNYTKVNNILEILKTKCEDIPIIFTCRSHFEGGYMKIGDEARLELFENAIATGNIDAIDLELAFGSEKINYIKSQTVKNGVRLILSYHNFTETPSEEFMIEKIKNEIFSGADIAKVAVMPNNQGDVLKLLNATYRARMRVTNPLITISMDSLGIISRLAGWMFGSDMTFTAGDKASAPGQVSIGEMRMYIDRIMG